MILGTAGNIRV